MRLRLLFPYILTVTALFAISCSGGSPTIPDPYGNTITPQISNVTESSRHLWGMYDVQINTDDWTINIIPIRGAEFNANVTMFLQPPAGTTTNLQIAIIDVTNWFTDGLIDVDVTLVHPFPGLDIYTGFDVHGVFINDGDTASSYDTDVVFACGEEVPRLLNADGFTRWYNPIEFTTSGILGFTEGAMGNKGVNWTAAINPYKYFCDGLDSEDDLTQYFLDEDNIETRGLFSSTGSNTRRYELDFTVDDETPVLNFQYAVVASWEMPTVEPPMDIPADFPITANCAEPFNLSVADNGSTLFYDAGIGGGTLSITAELFDWNAPYNPSGVLGEFSKIVIESLNVTIPGGYVELTPADLAPYLLPSTSVSSVTIIEFDGIEPVSADDAEFLVTVEGKSGETYDQGYPVDFPESPLAGYWFFTIPVGDNPCGNFTVTGADPAFAESGEYYDAFTVYGTNFQAGANLAVDVVDGVNVIASAVSVVLTDITTINCEFDFCGVDSGDFDLRVTNGCDPVSYASIAYTVGPDPLKNMDLRDGIGIRDISVCEYTGEGYIIFDDGQLWIYEDDYASGVHKVTDTNLDRIATQRDGDASVVSSTVYNYSCRIYYLPWNQINVAGAYAGTMIDVMGAHNNNRHYYVEDCGLFFGMIRRNIAPTHGGFLSGWSGVGSGPGKAQPASVKGVDTTHSNVILPYANQSSWFYFLEGAPEYAVERLAYIGASSNHSFIHEDTHLSGPGDGDLELNDPQDIACDFDGNIFILDILLTGEPIIKMFDYEMTFIGTFGDSITISGTPLRLDTDDGDGEVHVIHTNGVSVFRPCELPL